MEKQAASTGKLCWVRSRGQTQVQEQESKGQLLAARKATHLTVCAVAVGTAVALLARAHALALARGNAIGVGPAPTVVGRTVVRMGTPLLPGDGVEPRQTLAPETWPMPSVCRCVCVSVCV